MNLIKICVWTCDMTSRSYFDKMNSTLGSVVPLAMFTYLDQSSDVHHVLTCCTSLDCVKYYAPQYNTSNGRRQKFVTLEVSPSSETNYVVAQWTGQLPLSKIIGNNIRFHDKTFISSFSFTNVKIRQNSKMVLLHSRQQEIHSHFRLLLLNYSENE